jgi:cytochrome b5
MRTDCWIILGDASNGEARVYDVTDYLEEHPGGSEVILEFAGRDAHDLFEDIGHSTEARNQLHRYQIGVLITSSNRE